MKPFALLAAFKRWTSERELRRDIAEFSCAHCELNARCARASSEDCVEKLEQIAQGDQWRHRRHLAQPGELGAIPLSFGL